MHSCLDTYYPYEKSIATMTPYRQKDFIERISTNETLYAKTRYLTLQNQTKRFLSSKRWQKDYSILKNF